MNAIIMAGGSGTRFWPASREVLPKQFLRITGDRTMLEETIARIAPTVGADRISVIVGSVHQAVTAGILQGRPVEMLVEPVGRNTAACIGLAALHWRRRDPGTPLVVLPADHYIADAMVFNSVLQAAEGLARDGGLVTIGIEPTRPETGYGYIRLSDAPVRTVEPGGHCYYEVERFVEKPDLETAVSYLTSGDYLWNSGIFIFTPETILAEIRTHLPELADGLDAIDQALDAGDEVYREVLERIYGGLPSISIDHGIIEKTRHPLHVFRAEFGWSDVGSWQALFELRPEAADERGNLIRGRAWVEDSARNLVYSTSGRRVALLGVEGLAIVDTDDTLMVADLTRSQDVKLFALREKRGD